MLEAHESSGRTEHATRLRYVAPGLALRISDLTDSLGGYRANVVETTQTTIWIDLPMRRDGMLSLSIGQLVSVRFDRSDDAAYLFDSVVTEVREDDAAPFGLAMPVSINRRPHRSDARLALVLDAQIDAQIHDGGAPIAGKVVDLSAGGLGLICSEEIDVGAALVVHTSMPGPGGATEVHESVSVRSASLYGRTPSGVMLYHYGLKFDDPHDELRELILSAVIWNLTRNPEVL